MVACGAHDAPGKPSARYRLPEHVSYCLVGGRPVFLDLEKDRYFRLEATLEPAFAAYLKGGEGLLAEQLLALVERGILAAGVEDNEHLKPVFACPAHRSALELPDLSTRLSPLSWLKVLAEVLTTRHALKTQPLKQVVDQLVEYRRQRAVPDLTAAAEQRLLQSAASFRKARLYVPVAPTCLLDSIALVRYLAGRSLHSNLIFGVNCNPFSAHAWVQAGDLVLNETVGEAIGHVPIRVA